MNRRQFISSSSVAALGVGRGSGPGSMTSAVPAAPVAKPVRLKLGCQSAPTSDTHLKYLARYGVKNICGYPEIADGRIYATVEELSRMKDLAVKNGIEIDCVGPPVLTSSYIDNEKHPAIMLAKSPERDRDIEQIQMLIRNCAQVGLPSIKYNMSILGVLRTGRTPGRGDAMYSQWKLSDAKPKTPLTIAGHVDGDMFWERITYFLNQVIPVANEYEIRMACHPQDPGVPPEGRVRPGPAEGGTHPLWGFSLPVPAAAFPAASAAVRGCARIPPHASPLRPARSGWPDDRWRSARSCNSHRYGPWMHFDCTSSARRRASRDPP